uniref:Putative secreted protein n=1 Tax=Ixodes ricinus TaxID=34613 RepID=A0A6B0UIX1_IXORI
MWRYRRSCYLLLVRVTLQCRGQLDLVFYLFVPETFPELVGIVGGRYRDELLRARWSYMATRRTRLGCRRGRQRQRCRAPPKSNPDNLSESRPCVCLCFLSQNPFRFAGK